MAEHKSSSSVACCTSVELPTLAATPSPSPPWIWPSLHLSFQPWTATSPAYSRSAPHLLNISAPCPISLSRATLLVLHGVDMGLAPATSPRWVSSGRRDAASYTSCASLVLALALVHGAAAATTLLRVAPSTCSMKYCSELQLDLHSPCATSQTPLVVDVVLRASSVRRKSQVHGQHIHNSNPIGQVV